MSRIFDALQQCERERSGAGQHTVATAGQLLRRAEEQFRRERPETDDPGEPGGTIAHALHATEEESARSEVERIFALPQHKEALSTPTPPLQKEKFRTNEVARAPRNCLVSITDPDSLAAEKFRCLAVHLQETRTIRPLKTVLVTSTIPNEGKSTLAANLACTIAATMPGKTLLLDGDLRRSSVARLFGLDGISGLTECLNNEQSLEASVVEMADQNLWLLVGGRAYERPLELLQAGALPATMERLKSWFDWIIIDSAPVVPMADTSIWMGLADGILLVTRPGTTKLKQLKKGLEAIEANKLIGAVSNCSRSALKQDEYYYSYARRASN